MPERIRIKATYTYTDVVEFELPGVWQDTEESRPEIIRQLREEIKTGGWKTDHAGSEVHIEIHRQRRHGCTGQDYWDEITDEVQP